MSLSHRTCLVLASLLTTVGASTAFAEVDTRDVVRDSQGNIVMNSFNNCVRTSWVGASDACAAPARAEARKQMIAQEERTVYFGFNKSTLSPDSKQRLDSLANKLKTDEQVKQAQIVGTADRIGNAAYNEALSKKRAETVRSYLVSRGFIKGRVADTRWLGETQPVTNCPDSLSRPELIECLQKDRRVEVEIEYYPDNASVRR